MTPTLEALAEQYDTDKLVHGYCPHYTTHLDRFDVHQLVEIGVYRGGSLRMWRDWMPHAEVVGIDNNPDTMIHGEERIRTVCIDAGDPGDWRGLAVPLHPDVVIDDGSHMPLDQLKAFQHLWKTLAPGGTYVIEDLGVVWDPRWGGANKVPNSTFPLVCGRLEETLRAQGVASFHAYEQICFMRKAA